MCDEKIKRKTETFKPMNAYLGDIKHNVRIYKIISGIFTIIYPENIVYFDYINLSILSRKYKKINI